MSEQNTQAQTPPPNYLVFAILVTIFCGKILGIVAIIFAAQVNSRWSAGDHEGAIKASRNAKLWSWISFAVGVAIVLLTILLSVLGLLAGLTLGGLEF